MKKIVSITAMVCLLTFSSSYVMADEINHPPTTGQFEVIKEESLSEVEKAFIETAKKHKGIHKYEDLYVISLGAQPNAGYGIELVKQEQLWEQLHIYVKQHKPEVGKVYADVIVYPYIIGKLDLPKYTTLSILDEDSKKPLFVESEPPIEFEKKQVITDVKKVWTITSKKAINNKDLKNYNIYIEKLGKDNKKHPVRLTLSKNKKTLSIQPTKPYEQNASYILYIKNKSEKLKKIPFEVRSGIEKGTLSYDYSNGLYDWQAGFSDLPINYEQKEYELESGHTTIPINQEEAKKGLMLSGHNRSDDLFMFAKKKIGQEEGLLPNTTYLISTELELYTNAEAGLIGIGGAPGESVFVKAGASNIEPKTIHAKGDLRMNIDKGEQGTSGKNGIIIGNAAKENSTGETYESKKLQSSKAIQVTTNKNGELWLFFGTDSGFEGKSTLYYSNVKFTIEKKIK